MFNRKKIDELEKRLEYYEFNEMHSKGYNCVPSGDGNELDILYSFNGTIHRTPLEVCGSIVDIRKGNEYLFIDTINPFDNSKGYYKLNMSTERLIEIEKETNQEIIFYNRNYGKAVANIDKIHLLLQNNVPKAQIAKIIGINRVSVYRVLKTHPLKGDK